MSPPGPVPALDHLAYLLFAVTTHAALGYALVAGFTDRPRRAGVVGAVLPDVDLLFPLAWSFPLNHRGLTHTLAFAAVVTALFAAARRPRWSAGAAALGLASHLLVDSFTTSGVAWLYPLTTERVAVAASIHSGWGAVLLWGFVALVAADGRRSADSGETTDGATKSEGPDPPETRRP